MTGFVDRAWLGVVLIGCLVAGCDDMDHQPRYDSYEPSSLFADGKSMQAPPEGTVARSEAADYAALRKRPTITKALLARGQERYDIYCSPCHDFAGYGQGTVPARGFPRPPSLHEARLREAPSTHIVDVISKGHGVMYSYADRVTAADRWAIAAYIRALQLSQSVEPAQLDAREREQLGGEGS